MLIEANTQLYYKDRQAPSIAKHISLDISQAATDAQINGELTLIALKKIEEHMESSPQEVDYIERSNIHQTLVEHERT